MLMASNDVKRDSLGRLPRNYVKISVLKTLENGPKTLEQIWYHTDTSKKSVSSVLNRLKNEELVTNFEHKWQLKKNNESGITARTDILIRLLDTNPDGLTKREILEKLNWDKNTLNQVIQSIKYRGLTIKVKLSL